MQLHWKMEGKTDRLSSARKKQFVDQIKRLVYPRLVVL